MLVLLGTCFAFLGAVYQLYTILSTTFVLPILQSFIASPLILSICAISFFLLLVGGMILLVSVFLLRIVTQWIMQAEKDIHKHHQRVFLRTDVSDNQFWQDLTSQLQKISNASSNKPAMFPPTLNNAIEELKNTHSNDDHSRELALSL
ncbi:MAG: hypothetical protein GF384_02145 [Elusimicrobia bacterium]|nr:hypothetical protein [Elusimicrobiota bacterium]MBD3411781.1 hypothetical protein [Elusimicrobiota bacterium]